jgi:hypothetical protein
MKKKIEIRSFAPGESQGEVFNHGTAEFEVISHTGLYPERVCCRTPELVERTIEYFEFKGRKWEIKPSYRHTLTAVERIDKATIPYEVAQAIFNQVCPHCGRPH